MDPLTGVSATDWRARIAPASALTDTTFWSEVRPQIEVELVRRLRAAGFEPGPVIVECESLDYEHGVVIMVTGRSA